MFIRLVFLVGVTALLVVGAAGSSLAQSTSDEAASTYAHSYRADVLFKGDEITVTAVPGTIPDGIILGVNAAVSDVPVRAPAPDAHMSVAGRFYEITAVTQDESAPPASYNFEDPITACLPLPDRFRAHLDSVVVVGRSLDGDLSIHTTKLRTAAGVLSVCGAISALPATVGVAKLGAVPSIPHTPMTEIDTPDTGATAPTYTLLLLTLLAGALLLTWMRRMFRIFA